MTGPYPLDNPVRSSLTGPHARFALRRGNVLRYPDDVSPFIGLPDQPDDADWADLAALTGPGGFAAIAGGLPLPPGGWTVTPLGEGVQMIDAGVEGAASAEAIQLTAADVPEMLDLTARTKPGPFLPRTEELGTYLGIRRGGALVAMAGERLHPPGWTEISAVCTDDEWRGHGLATVLIRALVASIRARGETPFLHALASNTSAIKLYEALGFQLRTTLMFTGVTAPAGQ